MKFRITCRHEVEAVYEVEGGTFEEARQKLVGEEIFRDQHNKCFGPDEYTMNRLGIKLIDIWCYGDPSPTGRAHIEREWEFTWEDETLAEEVASVGSEFTTVRDKSVEEIRFWVEEIEED